MQVDQETVVVQGHLNHPTYIHSFIKGHCTMEEYMAEVAVCFMCICLHKRILEMFVCNCSEVRKAAEQGIQLLFGQCCKGRVCEER
jgi:hypothetical protein